MQPDDMEKAFRQKMKSHTPAWDKNKNWDAIEARLPQQRKRRPWWIFWLLGATVLAGAVIWWAWAGTTAATAETMENQPVAKQNDPTENVAADMSAQAETTEPAGAPGTTSTPEPPVFTKKKNPSGETRTTLIFQEKTLTETPGNVAADAGGHSPESISPQEANPGPATAPTAAANDEAAETKPLTSVGTLEKLPVEARHLDLPQAETDLATGMTKPMEPMKNKARFGFEIYGGGGRPLRRFSTVSPEKQAYVSDRKQREQLLESIEAGILLTVRFRGGWSLATGLEFQKINEKFSWQNLETETVSVYSDSAYFYFDAVNQRQYLGDTVQATRTERRRVTNFNSHTFLNVPLLAGFEKRFPHFSLRASGGPVLQFYRGFGGRIFDENEALVDGEVLRQGGIYQNKMALSLQAGLDIGRHVGRWGEVFAGLQYRHGLTSLTGGLAGYEQRYGSLGARLGWRF